jgi:hypothetical protein
MVAEAVEAAGKQDRGQSVAVMANGLLTPLSTPRSPALKHTRSVPVAAELNTAELIRVL